MTMVNHLKYMPTGAFTSSFQKKGVDRSNRSKKERITQSLLDVYLAILPKDKTVIDLGCAAGGYVRALRKHGYDAWGVDGTPGIEKMVNHVYEVDLASEGVPLKLQADWGICSEVGEHIPEQYFDQFLKNLGLLVRDGLIMFWADLHPSGKRKDQWMGHVNPRSQVYIAAEFGRRGWCVDEKLTQKGREIVHEQEKRKERLMVLRKEV